MGKKKKKQIHTSGYAQRVTKDTLQNNLEVLRQELSTNQGHQEELRSIERSLKSQIDQLEHQLENLLEEGVTPINNDEDEPYVQI